MMIVGCGIASGCSCAAWGQWSEHAGSGPAAAGGRQAAGSMRQAARGSDSQLGALPRPRARCTAGPRAGLCAGAAADQRRCARRPRAGQGAAQLTYTPAAGARHCNQRRPLQCSWQAKQQLGSQCTHSPAAGRRGRQPPQRRCPVHNAHARPACRPLASCMPSRPPPMSATASAVTM